MALNNILVPNPFNLYSNSMTFNTVVAQPVAGSNTVWIKSSNGHLWRDGVDLEAFAPLVTSATTFIPPASWPIEASNGIYDIALDSDNIAMIQATSGGGASVNITVNPSIGAPTGLALDSITVIYSIQSVDFTSITPTLSSVVFGNGGPNVVTSIPITGSFDVTASGDIEQAVLTLTTPHTLAPGETLNLILALTLQAASEGDFYGCYCNYSV